MGVLQPIWRSMQSQSAMYVFLPGNTNCAELVRPMRLLGGGLPVQLLGLACKQNTATRQQHAHSRVWCWMLQPVRGYNTCWANCSRCKLQMVSSRTRAHGIER